MAVDGEASKREFGFTVTNGAVIALADSLIEGEVPARIFVSVETAAIRFRYAGDDPGVGTLAGHPMAVDTDMILEGNTNVQNFKMIAQTSTDAHVYITLEIL